MKFIGAEGYTRWDARYEILLGNLLDPPVIAKEVLFASVDALRAALHEPARTGEDGQEVTTAVPRSLGTRQLDLAKGAFVRRGFSYVRQEDDFHYWHLPDSETDEAQVLLWESDSTVWVQASTPDAGLPTEARPITDVWEETGILPGVPTGGPPVSENILAVREGKRSPLSIRWRRPPVLHKPEGTKSGLRAP